MKIAAILMSSFLSLTAFAGLAAAADVTVKDAYSFAVPEGAKTGAAFMTMTYAPADGGVPDRLMKAETPVAGTVEIHMTVIEKDVMQMRPLEVLPLSPLGTMTLSPNGAHIMLMDLKKPLVAGESFPLTLTFEKAGAVTVDVAVRAPGDVPAENHGNHEADHGQDAHGGHH